MDEKNKIEDLPEPVTVLLSPEEQIARQWRLIQTAVQFITFYAAIHKVFIPLFLKWTTLAQTSYAEIQFSIIYSVILTLLLRQFDRNNRIISFWSGLCIVYACLEVYLTFLGEYVGWFAFSRLLSSIPLAASSIFLLSQRKFSQYPAFAWSGAVLYLVVTSATFSFLIPKKDIPTSSADSKNAQAVSRTMENKECGAETLSISDVSKGESSGTLFISDCGLNPSTWVSNGGGVQIENQTSFPVNLHLLYYEGDKKRSGWNILVPAKQKLLTPKIELSKSRIGLLYSDSKADVGIVGFRAQEIENAWNITRKPISAMQVIQGGK